jgi:hypothetical protein
LHQSHVSRSTGDAQNSRREPLAFLGVQENLRCPVDLRPLQWNEEERALVSSDGARRYPVMGMLLAGVTDGGLYIE